MLRHLAFASRARPGLRPADTSAIIATSRTNNARDSVTGVMLYSGESFLALVEGTDPTISSLWRRLLVDDRHRQLASLHGGSIAERWFVDWRAGYVAEQSVAPLVFRWRAFAPALPATEVERLRTFLGEAQSF